MECELYNRTDEDVANCLAALPDGRWPTVEAVDYAYRPLPAAVAQHVARLCPRLREIRIDSGADDGSELAAALDGLAASTGALELLQLAVGSMRTEPGRLQGAAASLGKLSGLRRLQVEYFGEADAATSAGLLAAALSSMTSLTALQVVCCALDGLLLPQLGAAPQALRELALYGGQPALDALRAAPQLGAVTKLAFHGCARAGVALPCLEACTCCCMRLPTPTAAPAPSWCVPDAGGLACHAQPPHPINPWSPHTLQARRTPRRAGSRFNQAAGAARAGAVQLLPGSPRGAPGVPDAAHP